MAVVPRDGQCYREANDEYSHEQPSDKLRPMVGLTEKFLSVRQGESRTEIGQTPLQDLMLFDPLPCALCRRRLGMDLAQRRLWVGFPRRGRGWFGHLVVSQT